MSNLTLHGLVNDASSTVQECVAVVFDDGDKEIRVTYRQLQDVAVKMTQVIQDSCASGEVIGVAMEPGPYLPSVLLGILSADCAFYCFEPQATEYVLQVMKQNGIKHIFTDSKSYMVMTSQMKTCDYMVKEVSESLEQIQHITLCDCPMKRCDCEDLAYCITTSGTTARPKVVHVPHRCIVPNIIHLRELFNVTKNDLLFLASPLTFDPSIVDIFVALSSGAAILIVPHVIKLMPSKLLDMVQIRHSVTCMQATPALISRIGPMMSQSLLGSETHLRVLALGGEKFPAVSLLRQWRASSNKTELFNLYGITEVSCWATYYKVTSDDLCRENWNVPLGCPLMGTEIAVIDELGQEVTVGDGQLYVGGEERSCHIPGGSGLRIGSQTLRGTGDWVTVREDGSIEYIGRRDEQTKRNGRRIDLQEIEKAVERLEVTAVKVLLTDEKLIVCIQQIDRCHNQMESMVTEHLRSSLPSHYQPDVILSVSRIPITKHGKLDKDGILEMARNKLTEHEVVDSHSACKMVTKIWGEVLNLKKDDIEDEDMFVLSGGDSLQAIKFVDMIEFSLKTTFTLLLDTVLHKPFCEIVEYVLGNTSFPDGKTRTESSTKTDGSKDNFNQSIAQLNPREKIVNKRQKTEKSRLVNQNSLSIFSNRGEFILSLSRGNRIHNVLRDVTKLHRRTEMCPDLGFRGSESKLTDRVFSRNKILGLREVWKHNTEKCVDASPLICLSENGEAVVFIGSHSHTFDAVAMETGELIWRTKLGDRVESSACLSNCGKFIIVGCYDSCIYVLDATSGATWWKFETGGEVKSSPVTDSTTSYIYVGSHDKHLYSLDVEKKKCIWSVYLGGGSIFSSPDICLNPHHVYAATLAGNMTAVCPKSGDILWQYDCGKPVFCMPLSTQTNVCIGCVDGLVYCFTHAGQLMWKFITGAPVFSSTILVHNLSDCLHPSLSRAEETAQVVNSNLIFGSHDQYVYCISLTGEFRWKTKLDSAVYSSPCALFVYNKHTLNYNMKSERTEIIDKFYEETNVICAATTKGNIYLLNCISGEILGNQKLPGEVFSSPVVCGTHLLIGCRDNYMYCLEIHTKDERDT